MNEPLFATPKNATAKDIWLAIKDIYTVTYTSNPRVFAMAMLLLLVIPFTMAGSVTVTNNLVVAITHKSDDIALWSWALIGIYVFMYTMGYIRSRNGVRLVIFSLHQFEHRAIEHLAKLPMSTIENPSFRKLHGQYTRDFYTIRTVIQTVQGTIGNLFRVVGWGSVLLLVPPATVVLSLIGMALYGLVAYMTFKTEAEIQEIRSEKVLRSDYFRTRLMLVTLQATLRTNQLSKPFVEKWDVISKAVRQELLERRLKVRTYNYVADLFEPISLGVGLLSLLPSYLSGHVEAASALTFLALYPRLWDNVVSVMANISDMSASVPFMLTYNAFHSIPEENCGTRSIPNKPLSITFENVSFGYPGNNKPVLTDINFTFSQGDQLALIGLNGAGKSTLLKLLIGLYHPTSGRILVNGIDLREADPSQWHKQLAYMDQAVPHFDDTLSEQIRYGNYAKPLDKKRLTSALFASGFDEIANEYPHGLETHAGRQYASKNDHPVELSGGQNQILTIARTLYRDAKLYIFDEPTSAVDALKEEQFFNRLPQALEGKTTLFISHRFSTVRRAKRIIVLSDGMIIEDGSHDELMKEDGLYAQLFNTQAKAYTTD
ncbi:MAG: ABC transporter ATP-binding protein [Patescibacteria group bacterium]